MDEFVGMHRNTVVQNTLKSLEQHGFGAKFCSSRQEAADFIMAAAKDAQTVGIAGTHTVRALGIVPMLEQAGKTLYDHWQHTIGTPEDVECRREQMTADLFLSSANAVTMTGEIVNRDGVGNRVNAMTFGPKKVVVCVGVNKLVPDIEGAMARLEEKAGPRRAVSLNRKTPCVKAGICTDCDSPERICRITSIIHRKPMMTDITVVILDEVLGY